MRNKYIVVDVASEMNAFEVAICFPDTIGHADMARRMDVTEAEVLSAGFFTTSVNAKGEISVDAYGESVGLNKQARMEDSQLVAKSIGAYKR